MDHERGKRPISQRAGLLILLSLVLIGGAFLYGMVSDAEFRIGIVLGVALAGALILLKALATEVD